MLCRQDGDGHLDAAERANMMFHKVTGFTTDGAVLGAVTQEDFNAGNMSLEQIIEFENKMDADAGHDKGRRDAILCGKPCSVSFVTGSGSASPAPCK